VNEINYLPCKRSCHAIIVDKV